MHQIKYNRYFHVTFLMGQSGQLEKIAFKLFNVCKHSETNLDYRGLYILRCPFIQKLDVLAYRLAN